MTPETEQDIRWIQRFDNFKRALKQLDNAVAIKTQRDLSELEQQGMIQAFEYNYELAWNVIKDFYQHQGELNIQGSRDAFRLAFRRGFIHDEAVWFEMIESRALSVNTYDKDTSSKLVDAIEHSYYPVFCRLKHDFEAYLDHKENA
ncbi:nucleotidyltransferase substrate binding protein [Hydrogenovibrio halophilus]|uniref:nucleotidyltransferase substrate binding protein n=1 Tax=Hydrogenovibrio halophilus TaxID=373391 RepID=UPI00035D173C|nr:nucleotidyltransferase substrate binding protein [Hydrogenovibrio halophilus]